MPYDEFDPYNRYRNNSQPLYGRPAPEGLQLKWQEMPEDDSQNQAIQGGASILEQAMKRKMINNDIGSLTDKFTGHNGPIESSATDMSGVTPQFHAMQPPAPSPAMPAASRFQMPRARKVGLQNFSLD